MSWSNNPNPNQDGGYDHNLLIGAPQAPPQLWQGYDVGLLEGGRPQPSQYVHGPVGPETSAPPAAPPPTVHQGPQVPAAVEKGSKDQFVESGGAYASKSRTGFWRSRKGIMSVVVTVVVIGAVVGGAVGGTIQKPSSSTETPENTPLTTTTDLATATAALNPAASDIVPSPSNAGTPQ
ncbi:hypothetical protein EDD16DRAFT_1557093 [Pisolithus croceorrhizus]|nr:hypothetical protein EDD16DRAFT_1557093 [Pisolithus croceorrhizus]